jgi:hypothetical protein
MRTVLAAGKRRDHRLLNLAPPGAPQPPWPRSAGTRVAVPRCATRPRAPFLAAEHQEHTMNNDKRADLADDAAGASAHRDPLSGEPGAHPVGVGVGAAVGGAAVGAAVGTVAGPIGTGIGAAVGAVAGGMFGKGVAEGLDPTAELAYWRENYRSRDYVHPARAFEDYAPAYEYGVRSYQADRGFDEVEPELAGEWDKVRGRSDLEWTDARPAARDAWERLGRPDRSEL